MKDLSSNPSILNFQKLVHKLENGSVVLFPTDTLPALGVYPKYASKLWEIKKRPLDKPLILMGAQTEDLFEYVLPCALNDANEMASLYWPGPLTMALPISQSPFHLLNPVTNTLGMRVPKCSLARDFLKESGPLATTSANLSGQSPVLNAREALTVFPDLPLLGPIPWPKPTGLASTVILWKKKGSWRLIRQGAVTPKANLIN